MITWDILIPTIPHRHEKLCALLAEIDRQWQPGLGVRVLRDNLKRPGPESHAKRQDLLEASQADYVCCVDDDDWIAEDYVVSISLALQKRPDYVGFMVYFTENGYQEYPVSHSLEHGTWCVRGGFLVRDISHLNPMRRDLAQLIPWHGITDEQWAAGMRKTGRVQTQQYIPRDMYFYRRDLADGWSTPRSPLPWPLPQLPSYPWLTVTEDL